MRYGFSTGSLALADFRKGLRMGSSQRATAIELSALREEELDPLLKALDSLQGDLQQFKYVSFHAPSRLERLSEAEFVNRLQAVADRSWAIIVHPDVIQDFSLWRKLGKAVCVENMDKRKRIGRTTAQLRRVFEQLPDATFCFDIGHARQVDPTMQEAEAMLQAFQGRLREVHMSYVNSQSGHERLNFESILAYQRVARLVTESIPIILETPVHENEVDDEITAAERVFASMHRKFQEESQSEEEQQRVRIRVRA